MTHESLQERTARIAAEARANSAPPPPARPGPVVQAGAVQVTLPTPSYPYDVQLREVQRELAYRARVYPRWIGQGKMTQRDADSKNDIMKAVADTLRALAKSEELPL